VYWNVASAALRNKQDAPRKFPNIGYAGKGYDIVKGNPRCKDGCVAGFDPGWDSTVQVIDMVYTNKTTADGRFLVPTGFELEQEVACELVSSTSSVQDAYSYQQSLNVDAETNDKIFVVQFSASVDYSHVVKNVGASSQTRFYTSAACSVYRANTEPYTVFNLTPEFKTGVSSLPTTYDASEYLTFTQAFGTHYTSTVLMGAKLLRYVEFSSSDYQSMTQKGINVQAAVQVDAVVAHVQAGANVTWHQQDYSNFKQFSSQATENVLGLAPPDNAFTCQSTDCNPSEIDAGPWQQVLLADNATPMPIQYTFKSLDSLLIKDQFPDDADIATKQSNLQQFLANDYCKSVPNCAPPNPNGYWNKQPDSPQPRIAAAGVSLDDTSFAAIGGIDGTVQSTGSVSVFTDSDSGIGWSSPNASQFKDMPTPRHNLSAAVSQDGFLYAIGGQSSQQKNTALTTVEEFVLSTNVWSTKKAMPTARHSLSAAMLSDGRIYVVGGSDGSHALNVMESLEHWSKYAGKP